MGLEDEQRRLVDVKRGGAMLETAGCCKESKMRVGPMYDDIAVARGCHFVCYLSGACYVDTLSSSGGRELKEDVMVEKGVEIVMMNGKGC